MEKLVGYARIAVGDTGSEQNKALRAAGCTAIFTDYTSGPMDPRPGLERALAAVKPGGALVVTKLDRPGRSLQHVLSLVAGLAARRAGLLVLDPELDTREPHGQKALAAFTALADFEHDVARERAGGLASRDSTRAGGRPALLSSEQTTQARRLYSERELTVAEIGARLGVSRATVYRALDQAGEASRGRRSVKDTENPGED